MTSPQAHALQHDCRIWKNVTRSPSSVSSARKKERIPKLVTAPKTNFIYETITPKSPKSTKLNLYANATLSARFCRFLRLGCSFPVDDVGFGALMGLFCGWRDRTSKMVRDLAKVGHVEEVNEKFGGAWQEAALGGDWSELLYGWVVSFCVADLWWRREEFAFTGSCWKTMSGFWSKFS